MAIARSGASGSLTDCVAHCFGVPSHAVQPPVAVVVGDHACSFLLKCVCVSDETGLASGSKSGAEPSRWSETSDMPARCRCVAAPCWSVWVPLPSLTDWVRALVALPSGGVAREVQRVISPSHGGLAAALHFGLRTHL